MRLSIVLCCVFLLAACSTPAHPPLPTADSGPYRLDSGDKIRVIVYGEQTLSTEYAVDDNGSISIPMVGEVTARAKTVADLRSEVADRLKKVLVNPSVSVEIIEYRPFFIVGEVGKPGEYPFRSGLNVLAAVAMAGGFTVRADQERLTVVRNVDGHPSEWSASRLSDLRPGDLVVVPERFF